jgi:hypothetical protein
VIGKAIFKVCFFPLSDREPPYIHDRVVAQDRLVKQHYTTPSFTFTLFRYKDGQQIVFTMARPTLRVLFFLCMETSGGFKDCTGLLAPNANSSFSRVTNNSVKSPVSRLEGTRLQHVHERLHKNWYNRCNPLIE